MKFYLFTCLAFISIVSYAQFSLPGEYKTAPLTFIEKARFFLKGIDGVAAGSELSLHKDSSFSYTTCGNIMTGKWKFDKKILYLDITSNKFRVESLNNSFPINQPLGQLQKFKLRRGKLVYLWKDGRKKYIEMLSRTE